MANASRPVAINSTRYFVTLTAVIEEGAAMTGRDDRHGRSLTAGGIKEVTQSRRRQALIVVEIKLQVSAAAIAMRGDEDQAAGIRCQGRRRHGRGKVVDRRQIG